LFLDGADGGARLVKPGSLRRPFIVSGAELELVALQE